MWTPDDELVLGSLIQAYRDGDKSISWVAVAETLGRTPESCRAKFKRMGSTYRPQWQPRWTIREVLDLDALCQKEPQDWDAIAARMSTKSARACKAKWATRAKFPTQEEITYLGTHGPLLCSVLYNSRTYSDWVVMWNELTTI